MTDRYAARPVFYHVRDDSLPLYVDMGLALFKLGEDALVPLADFGVEGSKRAELRQAISRATRDGASFEVVRAADVPALVPELAAVSTSWLASKSTAEKGFSIGAFSPEYIACFDCAVVRVGERIVAFANLWQAPKSKELSVDLMRYGDAAPKVVMDYLLTEVMLWGRKQGFEWFSLGMAPLSGLEARPLAPMWHKVGGLIFRYGDDFYNFEGLRHYKEKFFPTWRPRYLACPAGLDVPRALFDATALISGGVRKILTK
jgi:phosphatidylglycerol lysyltransferase